MQVVVGEVRNSIVVVTLCVLVKCFVGIAVSTVRLILLCSPLVVCTWLLMTRLRWWAWAQLGSMPPMATLKGVSLVVRAPVYVVIVVCMAPEILRLWTGLPIEAETMPIMWFACVWCTFGSIVRSSIRFVSRRRWKVVLKVLGVVVRVGLFGGLFEPRMRTAIVCVPVTVLIPVDSVVRLVVLVLTYVRDRLLCGSGSVVVAVVSVSVAWVSMAMLVLRVVSSLVSVWLTFLALL